MTTKAIGIYGWHNTANDKWYIGQSVDMYHRRASHLYKLRRGLHANNHLQAAFTRYGEACFTYNVLEVITVVTAMDAREQYWISHYNSNDRGHGYNIEAGGGTHNKSVSDATRKKIAKMLRGRNTWSRGCRMSITAKQHMAEAWEHRRLVPRKPMSVAQRKKIALALKGKHPSELTRQKLRMRPQNSGPVTEAKRIRMRIAQQGKVITLETRAKMSAAHSGKVIPAEVRLNMAIGQRERRRKEQYVKDISNTV